MRWAWLVALCACRYNFDPIIGIDATGSPDGNGSITTITFGERPTSMRQNVTSDATLDELQGAFNFGATEDLALSQFMANDEHGLLRFDLSSLPPGTPVMGARLHLVRLDFGDEAPGTIVIRQLAESWVEGTSSGSPGGGVSWSTRDGTTAWQTPGGTTSATLATITPSATEVIVPIAADVVRQWIDDPASNAGVLITVTTAPAHYHIHSSDGPTTQRALRPELAVDVIE